MKARLLPLTVTLVACAALAACGDEVGPGAPPPTPEQDDSAITLQGVIQAGVEPGCLLLSSGGTDYLLLADGNESRALVAGQTVTVRGDRAEGQASTCQQGVPFDVDEVRAG